GQVWGVTGLSPAYLQANTTIYAVHASNGEVAWSHSLATIPYRGWLTASNGLIFAGALDGSIHILDAKTGQQVDDLYVGPSLYESPTLGSGIDGQVYLYQLTSAASYGAFGGGVPGDLMAYTVQSSPFPTWETYVPGVAVGLLAAVVLVVLVENRSLRKAAKRGSPR
ncbi:MAG TPA: PQQ-binding-like beta-propeller repeat protein, partial [Nitrososphaerales archaeon]|nr:PQQ-binding-like beta-propeller repeat protein [Nitrososphaerales archaeon]